MQLETKALPLHEKIRAPWLRNANNREFPHNNITPSARELLEINSFLCKLHHHFSLIRLWGPFSLCLDLQISNQYSVCVLTHTNAPDVSPQAVPFKRDNQWSDLQATRASLSLYLMKIAGQWFSLWFKSGFVHFLPHHQFRPTVKSGPAAPFSIGRSLLEDSLTHPIPLHAGHVDQWPFKSFTSPTPRQVLHVLSQTWYTSWQMPSRGSHVSSLSSLVFPSGGNSPQGLNIESGSALPSRRPLSLRGRDRRLLPPILTSASIRCGDAGFPGRERPEALPATCTHCLQSLGKVDWCAATRIGRRCGVTASGIGLVGRANDQTAESNTGAVENGGC